MISVQRAKRSGHDNGLKSRILDFFVSFHQWKRIKEGNSFLSLQER
ncbi:MAG: hypothetical protein P8H13_08915 [Polaribacter sp.]|nr:hypothetical protein [Polaribacter sp.]MDG1812042.1 hypothetical protein [Polaribacter sp.]MDG1993699.1 hypothetical protein [Polaribacter sp.]